MIRLKNGQSLPNALLQKDGCVSLQNVLNPHAAAELYEFISKLKVKIEEDVMSDQLAYDEVFGAVNNRRNRVDMFLPYEEVF